MKTALQRASIKTEFQRGLSLVELMISITIGLIILAALTTLFINQSRTRVELDKSNRMIDNGRYAMEILSNDLRLSGYFGEFSPPTPSGCSTVPLGTFGSDVGIAGEFAASPHTALAGIPLRKGSDVLVIQRASTNDLVERANVVDGVKYLQVSLCQIDALKYIVDSIPADHSKTVDEVFPLQEKACKQDAAPVYTKLRPMLEHVYFVSPDNAAGDGIPTLKRAERNTTTGNFDIVPLVEGIEYLQIEYGVDNNASFQLNATTTAAGLVLTNVTPDALGAKVMPGMGVYNNPNIPAGYTVETVSPTTITTSRAAGANDMVAATPVTLTIPYLTATLTSGSNVLTNPSGNPKLTMARPGHEICASGIPAGATIAEVTETTITITKEAVSTGTEPLSIPSIAISPIPVAGDGAADNYKASPSNGDWPNVVSVKLTLLARNTEPTRSHIDSNTYTLGRDAAGNVQTAGPFNAAPYNAAPYPTTYPKLENYKRHVYTQFIRLVNTAGRRETQ